MTNSKFQRKIVNSQTKIKKVIIVSVLISIIAMLLCGCDISNKIKIKYKFNITYAYSFISGVFHGTVVDRATTNMYLSFYYPDEKYIIDNANKIVVALNNHDIEKVKSVFSTDLQSEIKSSKGKEYLFSVWGENTVPKMTGDAFDYALYSVSHTSKNYSGKLKILDFGRKIKLSGETYNLWVRAIRTDAPKDKTGVFALYLFKDGDKSPKSWYEYNVYQPVGIYVPEDFDVSP